ncbi:MAG: DUF2851 family protein [Cyclobacteriaceae bacterium]
MDEAFLHFVWKHQYFNKQDLQTNDGLSLEIIHPGNHNRDAGPDFSHAKLRMGKLLWTGSVEIHLNASDWHRHGHQKDLAYDAVILHVVWQNDIVVHRTDGTEIPFIELKTKVRQSVFHNYRNLFSSTEQLLCTRFIGDIPRVQVCAMLDSTLLKRMERKANEILEKHKSNQADWEETAYQVLLKSFGFNKNNEAFEALAKELPLKALKKHGDNLLQVEALLFGMAGFLSEEPSDDYMKLLCREYNFLSEKYGLKCNALRKYNWKFLRMRPANFPTLRLAQLATMIVKVDNIFSALLYTETVKDLCNYLEITPSDYWQNHYHFSKPSKKHIAEMGIASVEGIMINTVAPLMVAYGIFRDDNDWLEKAISLLQTVPAEKNSVVERVKSAGISPENAYDTQAMIELYRNFCVPRKCLDCQIGTHILKPSEG